MRIKPLKAKSIAEVISSFPSLTQESDLSRLALPREYVESLEIDGKLLILSGMNKLRSLKMNKIIHDTSHHGMIESFNHHVWCFCDCEFAFRIRCEDLGIEPKDELREVI